MSEAIPTPGPPPCWSEADRERYRRAVDAARQLADQALPVRSRAALLPTYEELADQVQDIIRRMAKTGGTDHG